MWNVKNDDSAVGPAESFNVQQSCVAIGRNALTKHVQIQTLMEFNVEHMNTAYKLSTNKPLSYGVTLTWHAPVLGSHIRKAKLRGISRAPKTKLNGKEWAAYQ